MERSAGVLQTEARSDACWLLSHKDLLLVELLQLSNLSVKIIDPALGFKAHTFHFSGLDLHVVEPVRRGVEDEKLLEI